MMKNAQLVDTDNLVDTPVLDLDTRTKILRAAIELFADSGYDGASLRQITDRAGVKNGLVRYHFNNKDQLWRDSVKFLYKELERAVSAPNDDWEKMSPREKAEYDIRSYIRFLAKNPALYKISMFETLHDSPRLDWLTENITIPYTKKSMAWIAKAKDEGVISSKIPDMNLFYMMIASHRNIFFLAPEIARVFGKDVFCDAEIRKHEDAYLELFLGS